MFLKEVKVWDVLQMEDRVIPREELPRMNQIQRDRLDYLPVSKTGLEGDRTVVYVNLPERILNVGGEGL